VDDSYKVEEKEEKEWQRLATLPQCLEKYRTIDAHKKTVK
jgi:hypothetical protein